MTTRRDYSEEELHALPDFKAIEDAYMKYADALDDMFGQERGELNEVEVQRYADWIERHIAHIAAIEHSGHHRFAEIAPLTGIPVPLALIARDLSVAMWKDAFIIGALYQKARTEELASTVIPDNLEGLA